MTDVALPSGRGLGFRRHFRAEIVDGEAAYLVSEQGITALQGNQVERLVPLLDGSRDLPTVLRDAQRSMSPGDAAAALFALADANLLTHRDADEPGSEREALAYWDRAGLNASAAAAAVGRSGITLRTGGGLDPAPALASLTAAGLDVVDPDRASSAALAVVLCADYLDPWLAEVDQAQRAIGQPWLLAKPVGEQVWIGPVFQPVEGACWSCLASRVAYQRTAESYVQAAVGGRGPIPRPRTEIPPVTRLAQDLIALEAAKWLAGYRQEATVVHTVDTLDLAVRQHPLRRRPQCRSCGDPGILEEQAGRPIVLVSRPVSSRSAAGFRAHSAEEVVEAHRDLVSPITGIVRAISRDRRGPTFLNAFLAGDNAALDPRTPAGLKASLRSGSGGKGKTATQAEASALCEAIERYSGIFDGTEARVRGSYRQLADRALHPDTCQLFHARQFAERSRWNAGHSALHRVAEPFDEDREIDWTPVWSLTRQAQRLLPTEFLYYQVPAQGPRSILADSNGAAAGTSLEDAILQGLLEVVERDAVAIWWYNRTSQPGIDLTAQGDPWIDELQELYAAHGREVWALDLTSDVGVPVTVALSRRTDKPCEDIVFGFGAHLDPSVALTRALTEMNQLLPAVLGVRAGGEYECGDTDAREWWTSATVAGQPHLVPDSAAVPVGRLSRPPQIGDLREAVEQVAAAIERLGHEILVLDQTRPDVGLPVVKVVVPGFRHMWARFAPGRLYDVPVRLGRLIRATSYDDLNPIPIFI